MLPMVPSIANDTDASTSASTGTKSYVTPLNNHLNMTNAMVSLMAPSASCDRKDAIAMFIAICLSSVTYKPLLPISSCAEENYISISASS